MKLATRKNGHRDGQLVVVSRDLLTIAAADDIAPTLQYAVENWKDVVVELEERYSVLNNRNWLHSEPFEEEHLLAPFPRAWQWLDGSAFLSHGERMQQAFNLPAVEGADSIPLMYQGCGDDFLSCRDPIIFRDESDGLDFEGEYAVVVDDVPLGCDEQTALGHIRLVLQLNDVSLRTHGPREMKTGFGFIHAKPSSAFAPVAITPDELGNTWHDGRIHLPIVIRRNGEVFGCQSGSEMNFHFGQLIAYAATTRRLRAGTLIGSGTVSGQDISLGASCIAEVRALETIEYGTPKTSFLRQGEKVFMETTTAEGKPLFGSIEQYVELLPQNRNNNV
ncbi:fumarylacetoacetate (FAA) hydrolase [Buttiauxella sp. BIGb0552]|uniref:fumarylacetoacetate hydrolase family protein n=1 Tax=Buttiauxella sp. BIGb0552 TaxID=2485120 RepID=UPI00106490E0|nr:fumarylacetoacetate hydrolase family protein [Buttiauxella sp. BIGb0552]TDX18554.1 fumarylacetoacetate (FAA) hydrolase [Buttiauxella sp. BIGb0552]